MSCPFGSIPNVAGIKQTFIHAFVRSFVYSFIVERIHMMCRLFVDLFCGSLRVCHTLHTYIPIDRPTD